MTRKGDEPEVPTATDTPAAVMGPPPLPTPGFVVLLENDVPVCRPIPIGRGVLTIGRAATNDLVLDDPQVSNRHAVASCENARIGLEDLASTMGTFVNATRLPAKVWTTVDQARVIRLGRSILIACADTRPYARWGITTAGGYVVGPAHAIVLDQVRRAAARGWIVLVNGESGSGKSHVARHFHTHARNAAGPFVELNCTELAPSLIESQLFGARKGSFTGAVNDIKGVFELGHKGTVLLDEIGDLALDLQPKLLHVLESRMVRRLGESRSFEVDVMFVAATNVDLDARVADGRFRGDLFERIAQVRVRLPALRDRREEIPALVTTMAARIGGDAVRVQPTFIEACMMRRWDRNVRQMFNAIRDAVLREEDEATGVSELNSASLGAESTPATVNAKERKAPAEKKRMPTEAEIRACLVKHGGNADRVAEELGISRATAFRVKKRG